MSRDRATIEIANHSDRTYSYRVTGWQPAQFETCRALGEQQVQEGPIARYIAAYGNKARDSSKFGDNQPWCYFRPADSQTWDWCP